MTPYELVIRSLTETKTLLKHILSLGKIRQSTEDLILLNKLDKVISQLQHAHSTSKSKSTPISLERKSSSEIEELVKYCLHTIGTRKPEWQILAERNGWIPGKIR